MQLLGPARLAVLVAAFAVFMALAPGAAPANHVQCGDVITQDTRLDSDVTCEGETYGVTAVTIAADGVTLDLGGHRIAGDSSYEDETSNGIATDGERTGVTVQDGSVTGFSTGVRLSASQSTVWRMSLSNGSAGVFTDGADNLVRRMVIRNTGEFGLGMHGARPTASKNVVVGPLTCLHLAGEGARATHNSLSGCYEAGGVTAYSARAVVTGNRIARSAYGFSAFGTGAVITRNDFSGNDGFGLSVADSHALVDNNVANENVYDYTGPAGNGIEVHVAGAVVSDNTANRNGNLGIEAVAGTIDGGGNRASGNGSPAQCVGITCK